MTKGQRITVFSVAMLALLVGGYVFRNSLATMSEPGVVMMSTLIMLAFTVLFAEHYFTRPTDVIASTVAILLLLSPLHTQLGAMGTWYWIYWGYNAVLLVVSLLALLLFDPNAGSAGTGNRIAGQLKTVAVHFGNGKVLWFSLFALSLFFYVDSQSPLFVTAFCFAAVVLFVNPQKAVVLMMRANARDINEVGHIFGVQAGGVYLAKSLPKSRAVERFDVVGFRPNTANDDRWRVGFVLESYVLNEEHWLKIHSDSALSLDEYIADRPANATVGSVYYLSSAETAPVLDRFVGIVCERSTIERLRFEYSRRNTVQEGDLLQVAVGGTEVLYQVVEGITGIESLESKDEAALTVGEAVQLGVWDGNRRCFIRFGWVPDMSSSVLLARNIEPPAAEATEFQIGSIPNTTFPVFIDRETAVTHHLAVLGVTGSGKSVFSRNLVRQIAGDGTKIICVDFTNEYGRQLADLIAGPLIDGDAADTLFDAVDAIGTELDKFPNQRNHQLIERKEAELRAGFSGALREFVAGENSATLFELPDVTNSTGILEYTRWFFRALFDLAKNGEFGGRRICVVLEEAHTIVPEWNFLGIDDKRSSSVVNSIAQIALQGRKYGVGFIVIAQRTANVSKTVLTQCNSVVAFQQFDKTSADFLGNYMGEDFISSLTRLKPRHAIAVGKAFSSGTPIIFNVPDIQEPEAGADMVGAEDPAN